VYYINLDHRTDRKKEFLNEMKKVDFPENKIVRIPAIYDKKRGHLGCSKSHIKTLEQFINSKYKNCIIFEDDFEFTSEGDMEQIENVFQQNIPFDVIMLSGNEIKTENSEYSGLKRVLNAQTTSGYMVSKEFAPTLLKNFKEGCVLLEKDYNHSMYAVDQYWKKLQPESKWFIFSPKLGKQRYSYSDIESVKINYGI
jgi:GR25 family glycosyltransferase involved in LPS biosynthesis